MTHGVGIPKARRTTLLAGALAALALFALLGPALMAPAALADQPAPLPNLRVTAVTVAHDGPFGPTLAVTMTNDGGQHADDVRLVVEDAQGTLLMDAVHGWLPAGNSITYQTFHAELGYGVQTVRAEVDPEDAIAESDEADNVLTTDVDLGWPDLVAVFGDVLHQPPTSFPPDEPTLHSLRIAVRVENVGTAAAQGVSAAVEGLGQQAQPVPLFGLAPGASTTFWFDWQGPAGTYTLTATADPENAVPESNEDNNQAATIIRPGVVPDLPDLAITDAYLSTPYNGLGTQVTFRVENLGPVDAPATHLDVAYGNGQVERIEVAALAAAHVTWYSAPWPGTPGRHAVHGTIDPDHSIEEQNEWNNHAWFEAGEELPDLAVEVVAPVTAGKAYGDEVRVEVQVRNLGRAAAPPSTATIKDGQERLDVLHVPTLAPGAVFVAFAEMRLTPGVHRLLAEADVYGDAAETDESNNANALDFDIGAPALHVVSLSQDQEVPEEGITMQVEAAFAYSGALGLSAVEARLYDGDLLLATWTLHDLTDGAAETLGFAWNANEGGHTLRFHVKALATGAADPARAADEIMVDVRAPTPATCQAAGVAPGVTETCRRILLGEDEPAAPLLG